MEKLLEKKPEHKGNTWIIVDVKTDDETQEVTKQYLHNIITSKRGETLVTGLVWTHTPKAAVKFDTRKEAQCYVWTYVPDAFVMETE